MTKFTIPAELDGLAAAASLTQALLKHLNVASLSELADELDAGYGGGSSVAEKYSQIEFDPTQTELLKRYGPEIALIVDKPRGRRRVEARMLAVCNSCGGWVLVSGNPQRRCQVKLDCEGEVTKPLRTTIA